MVTIRDIAATLGLSVQTVSLALRGKGRMSDETRERVLRKATELGYSRESAFGSLSSYRQGGAPPDSIWREVALVHDWKSPALWEQSPFLSRLREHLRRDLSNRGVALREVWLGHHSENAGSVFQQLKNDGVTGVMVAPHAFDAHPVPVPVPQDSFQAITCGPAHLYPNFPSVEFDYYENFRIAWSALWASGYRRIGLVYEEHQDWRTGSAWRAARYVEARLANLDAASQVRSLELHGAIKTRRKAIAAWLRKNRPDIIITSLRGLKKHLPPSEANIPMAIMDPADARAPGVVQDFNAFTGALVNTLIVVMQSSLTPRARSTMRVLIPGKWQAGTLSTPD